MIPASFRGVLTAPGARRLIATSLIGRLPITFTSLATVLLVRQHSGSFATAGLVAGAEAVGAGAATPLQGRLIDRYGQPRVLVPLSLGNAAGLGALVTAALTGAPALVLAACGLFAGACLPPIGACMRALWPDLVSGVEAASLDTAYSVEAIMVEVLFIAGPSLATLIFAIASPAAALVVAAILALTGTLAFARTRAAQSWHAGREPHISGWALSAPGMRTLVGASACIGVAFGAVEVAGAAFSRAHGSAPAVGLLVAAMAAGSMAGGLWYGARDWKGSVVSRFVVFLCVLATGFALLLAPGSIPVMAVAMFCAGVAIAPTTACLYRLVDHLAPAGMVTEAFTWVSTAVVAGTAGGTALAGPLAQLLGTRAALAVPSAAAAVATLLALAGRASLTPAEAMVREA